MMMSTVLNNIKKINLSFVPFVQNSQTLNIQKALSELHWTRLYTLIIVYAPTKINYAFTIVVHKQINYAFTLIIVFSP